VCSILSRRVRLITDLVKLRQHAGVCAVRTSHTQLLGQGNARARVAAALWEDRTLAPSPPCGKSDAACKMPAMSSHAFYFRLPIAGTRSTHLSMRSLVPQRRHEACSHLGAKLSPATAAAVRRRLIEGSGSAKSIACRRAPRQSSTARGRVRRSQRITFSRHDVRSSIRCSRLT
jgi:hypothetical protein